jgi:hypothetical protein
MAAEHEITVDVIASKNGADISFSDFAAYDEATTEIDYIGTERLVPYSVVRSMVDNAAPDQVRVPIDANIATNGYDTMTVGSIPIIRIMILISGKYHPWYGDFEFDITTGIVKPLVDYTADSYVLVVG